MCPRLRSARRPPSRSSAATISRLGPTTDKDCVYSRRPIAGEQAGPVGFEPAEEAGVVDQPVFHHLGVSGPEPPAVAGCRGCRCRPAPGAADGRLRSGSFPCPVLMPVLPPTELSTCASRGRRDLNVIEATKRDGRGETVRSPTMPPPRASSVVPRSTPLSSSQPISRSRWAKSFVRSPAGRNGAPALDAGGGQRRLDGSEVPRRHVVVGDHAHPGFVEERTQSPTDRRQQPPGRSGCRSCVRQARPSTARCRRSRARILSRLGSAEHTIEGGLDSINGRLPGLVSRVDDDVGFRRRPDSAPRSGA